MNGIAVRKPPDEWRSRTWISDPPLPAAEGAWVGIEAEVTFGPTGHGLTSANLYDTAGHVGRAEQSLFVRPR